MTTCNFCEKGITPDAALTCTDCAKVWCRDCFAASNPNPEDACWECYEPLCVDCGVWRDHPDEEGYMISLFLCRRHAWELSVRDSGDEDD